MKRQKIDGEVERQILIALITSKQFLGQAAPILQKEIDSLRDSPLLRLISEWCLSYHADYRDAPRQHVEAIYHAWSEEANDEDLSETVHDLLEDLSDRHDEAGKDLNVPFLLARLGKMLTRKKLTALNEDVDAHLSRGDAAAADQAVQDYRTVEVGETAGVDPLNDDSLWDRAFQMAQDPIIVMRKDAGRFFNPALTRDALIAVQASDKKGKTNVLLELAWMGVQQRRKVAFFEVGDLSESQIAMRIGAKLTEKPARILDEGRVRIPKSLRLERPDDVTSAAALYRRLRFKDPFSAEDVSRARRTFRRNHSLPKDPSTPYFQLSVHPNDSISVRGIEAVLDRWANEKGFVPDCVAEGSLVLTDSGLVPIEDVTLTHRLWDGDSWVAHEGVVCRGTKEVITHGNLTATPDHEVWVAGLGWRTLESCRRLGLHPAKTGVEGTPIRLGEDHDELSEGPHREAPHSRKVSPDQALRSHPLHEVRRSQVDHAGEPDPWDLEGVPGVPSAQECAETLQRSRERQLREVRGPWDRIPVRGRVCGVHLGGSESEGGSKARDRPDRQRRALRTRQHPLLNPSAELRAHVSDPADPAASSLPLPVHQGSLLGCDAAELLPAPEADGRGDRSEVERAGAWRRSRAQRAPVWDIINAGPLHRFTVQGVLAHNCIVIDYADILAAEPGKRDEQDEVNSTWKSLRRLSQVRHALVITATQANALAYEAKTLGMKHFSRDKRKLAHVTGMFALNQTMVEKERQIMRYNWIVLRESDFNVARCLHVGTAFAVGKAMTVAKFLGEKRKS